MNDEKFLKEIELIIQKSHKGFGLLYASLSISNMNLKPILSRKEIQKLVNVIPQRIDSLLELESSLKEKKREIRNLAVNNFILHRKVKQRDLTNFLDQNRYLYDNRNKEEDFITYRDLSRFNGEMSPIELVYRLGYTGEARFDYHDIGPPNFAESI